MTKYNHRPSRSRRDNTLEKLRTALPVPSASEDDSRFDGGSGYGNGICNPHLVRKEGGEREARCDNCTGDISDGDHQDRLEGGPLANADEVDGDRCGGVGVSKAIERHRESYGSDSQRCQPSEPLEGNEGGAVSVSDEDSIVGTLMNPSPCSVENRPTVAEQNERDKNDEGAGDRQGNGARAVTTDPRKRQATSQRKVGCKIWKECVLELSLIHI